MRKADCVMIFICVVFLFFSLGAIGQAGRENARILACTAAEKQIAGIIGSYQRDNDGYVPVMLHKFSISRVAARASLLFLPFRHYSGQLTTLPEFLNPDEPWDYEQVLYYFQNYLPKFFVCPFVRGSSEASWWRDSGLVRIGVKSTGEVVERQNYKSVGLNDSYSTWMWPRPKGFDFWPGEHPYGPEYGKNKYGNLQWHAGGDPTWTGIWPDTPDGYNKIKDKPVRFSDISGISERTAVYCAQGEIDESIPNNRIINYRSHMKGNRGGTNVIFGDMHTEWVQGSQITAW